LGAGRFASFVGFVLGSLMERSMKTEIVTMAIRFEFEGNEWQSHW